MHRSLVTALVASLALGACTHSMPRTVVAEPRAEGFALPLVALSGAGRRVCAIGYADPAQCMYVDGDRTRVVDVPGTEGAVDVAVSEDRGCALFGSGAVACFGFEGEGTTSASLVTGLDDVYELAVGGELVCGRSEGGTVSCARGQEVFDVDGVDDAVELAVGAERACARTAGGELACWTASSPIAARVPGVRGVVAIGAGGAGVFALDAAGSLSRVDDWGRPDWVFATRVVGVEGGATLEVGASGACVQTARGEAICWDASASAHALRTVDRLADTRELAMGDRFACAVSSGGGLRCVGLAADAMHAAGAEGRVASR